MLVIGLTGGIGSGKSTVARLFAEKGVKVIDADQLTRDLTHIGQPILEKISHQFGNHVIQADGSLNRAELRKIIFNDNEKRIWLENLLHPLVREQIQKQVNNSQAPYCLVVIPLLLETKKNPLINRVLIVDTTEEEQLKRTQLRDNATENEIKAIFKTQVDRATRLKAADDIIENTGSIKDLLPQIDRLHDFYLGIVDSRVRN